MGCYAMTENMSNELMIASFGALTFRHLALRLLDWLKVGRFKKEKLTRNSEFLLFFQKK